MNDRAASAASAPSAEDLRALSWVQDEVRRSMEAAHKALHRHLREADAVRGSDVDRVDPTVLRTARTHFHQAAGALELVGMRVPAQVLRASEQAVQRLSERPSAMTAATVDTIERASFALADYLARLTAGKTVSGMALFPQYRSLLELAGADRIHPADLWAFDWSWRVIAHESELPPVPADTQAREAMERLILRLMRTPDRTTLRRMSDLCAGLGADAKGRRATMWRLAAGFFEAQAAGLLRYDVYVKRAAPRLLAQARLGLRSGDVSDRLANDLLFFCARAAAPRSDADAPRLAAVRRAYSLDRVQLSDYEASTLGRFDPGMLAQARKRVAAAREAWSAVAGGEAHRHHALGESFALVQDSLEKLYPQGETLGQSLVQAGLVATGPGGASAPLAMEVATAVLYLEASLEDAELDEPGLGARIRHLAERIDHVRAGGEPQPLEAWMEELYRRVSDTQTIGSVVQELRGALAEVEKHIDQFFRQPQQRELLFPVPGQLTVMRGVVSVLGLEAATQALLRMREDVDTLSRAPADPSGQDRVFERLADNLGSLSFMIDILAVQPMLAKALFRFEPETGRLLALMSTASREPTVSGDLPDTGPGDLGDRTQRVARDASRSEISDDVLVRELRSLAQQALLAEERRLADTLTAAQAALERTGDPDLRRTMRAELAARMLQLSGGPAVPQRPAVATVRAPVPASTAAVQGMPAIAGAVAAAQQDAALGSLPDEPLARPDGERDAPAARNTVDEPPSVAPEPWVGTRAPDGHAGDAEAPATPAEATQVLGGSAFLTPLSPTPGLLPPGEGVDILLDDLPMAQSTLPADAPAEPAADVEPPLAAVIEPEMGPVIEPALENGLETGAEAAIEPLPAVLDDRGAALAPVSEPALEPPPPPRPVASVVPAPAESPGHDDEAEMREVFLEEAGEVIEQAREAWRRQQVDARDKASDLSDITAIRRAFHTLKGSSRMVGLADFGEAAWACEQLYNARLAHSPHMDEALGQFTAQALDYLEGWTAAIRGQRDDGHRKQAVIDAAGALRLEARLVPLAPPSPVPVSSETADAASAAALEADEPAASHAESPYEPDVPLEQLPMPAIDAAAPTAAAPEAVEAPALGTAEAGFDAETLRPEEPSEVAADRAPDQSLPAADESPLPALDLAALDLPDLELPPLEPVRVEDAADDETTAWPALDAQTLAAGEPALDTAAAAEAAKAPEAPEAMPADALAPQPEADAAPAPVEAESASPQAVPPEPTFEPIVEPLVEPTLHAPESQLQAWPAFGEPPEGSPAAAAALPWNDTGAGTVESVIPSPLEEPVKVVGPLRIEIGMFNIYLNEADELSRKLGTLLAEWAVEPQGPPEASTVVMAHSLAGSSATVGFTDLSALARALEHALMRSIEAGTVLDGETVLYPAAADEIRRVLHQFAAGFLIAPSRELVERLERHPPSVADDTDRAGDAAPPVEHLSSAQLPTPAGTPAAPSVPSTTSPPPVRPLSLADLAHLAADDDIDARDSVDPELFPIFADEAQDLLPELQARMQTWLERPADRSAAAACMRSLHTFKGGARLAGAMRIGEMTHRLETAVERLMAGDAVQAADIEPLVWRVDAVETAFGQLRSVFQAAQADSAVMPLPEAVFPAVPAEATALESPQPEPAPLAGTGPSIDWSAMAARDRRAPIADAAPAPGGVSGAVRVRATLLDRLVNHAGEVSIARTRLESDLGLFKTSLVDLTENLDRLRRQLRDVEVQAESQISSRLEAAKAAAVEFDPLEMDRYTRVQELTRMMAESVNDVATVQRGLQRALQSSEDQVAQQARLTRSLQDDLLRTRMVEFDSLSERLYRVVRQAAKETGKQVRLDIQGGTIEIDRSVLERMTAPFEHLLRNAVTHGIERPDVRTAAGKPPAGTVEIRLHPDGNEVAVEFVDDGAGLDLPRIRQRALKAGLLAEGDDPTPEQLASFIFAPGFTTAETVTELAGRGVGMDVVRSEIRAIGGRVQVHDTPGAGVRFRLVLPLTTAVTQVVMLRCGETKVAVPANLVEIVRRETAAEVENAYREGSWKHGEESLPFHWLDGLLGGDPAGAVVGRSVPVVIVRSAAQRVALHVDEVLGNQEVVVKNLGPQLSRLPGLTGMTLLPSGVVAAIYNPVALAAWYGETARARVRALLSRQQAAHPAQEVVPVVPLADLVLVVDDSLTVRRVTQRLLQREGYRVVTAKDGLDALERIGEERPRVILSDIEMPRMDGFDFVRNLRADPALADLPVIMITSRIAQKHRDYALELGVRHYLGKPYGEEELLGIVAGLTRHEGVPVEA